MILDTAFFQLHLGFDILLTKRGLFLAQISIVFLHDFELHFQFQKLLFLKLVLDFRLL